MSLRQRIGVSVLCVVTLLVAVVLSGQAQNPNGRGLPRFDPPLVAPNAPIIISGPDLGFRIDDRDGNRAMGTLMVRINGQWVEAVLGKPGLQKLTTR